MPSPPAWIDDTSTHGKLFLIAAGTARYDHLPDEEQLPSVNDDLRRIVEFFTTRLGYERVLPRLGDNPTSGDIRLELGDWLNDTGHLASDRIVFYYSGHGVVANGKHYLLTSDSKMSNIEGRAFQVASLGSMLQGTPIQQILVILDTCYAGRGIADFGSVAQDHINSLRTNDHVACGFYAMAAARPKEEAQQGVFAHVLVETLEKPPLSCGGDQQEHLYVNGVLIGEINEKLKTRSPKQRARLDSLGVQSAEFFSPISGIGACRRGSTSRPSTA